MDAQAQTRRYQRIENGTVTYVSIREGLAEISAAQMDAVMQGVLAMSAISRTDFDIEYEDGRHVRLLSVLVPSEPERTAIIQCYTDGNHYTGRVVTVKGKDYVLEPGTPADERVTYWSVRDDERFGATRIAGPWSRPGTVGYAIYRTAMVHATR